MALNKTTLALQIYGILRDDILNQRIPCGSKLTLKALQERFEVSSTPVREALTRLVQDQLVTYYSNVGVSVVSLGEDDVQEVYRLMGDFDALAIIYASGHPDREALTHELHLNLTDNDTAVPGSPEWIRLSDEFHLIFYRYCSNSRLVDSAARLRSQLSILAYQYEKDAEADISILEEHRQIFDLFASGDTDAAAEAMRTHLQHSMIHALDQIRS